MPETDTTTDTPSRPRRRGRILLIAAAVVALLILALVPPYISVNRLQHRIAASISRSLGRTAHLDDVTLNLFPWPGFTLKNLVIDDDPAFSSEPVIRANVVTARLRLSSLWRRQVEFSTISFDTDNGSGPSINLVRNGVGQWNLEGILLQASRVDAAPTAQRTAGPAPRFPLIEATGARVNIKRGLEKLPFSLTDAKFELSLNNPQQWRISLEGHPARTDTAASDTGTLRIEGTLNRAASFRDVPIDLTATWDKSPLGEATRVLTGSDAGWRGDLSLSAGITGTLGAVLLDVRAHIAGLHRDIYSPSRSLDLDLRCTGRSSLLTRDLAGVQCLLPLDPANGRQVLLTGDVPDVHHLATARWNLAASKVPATWCLDWARLFSQRIPPELAPIGDVTGTLTRTDAGWSAAFHADLAQTAPDNTPLALAADLQLGPPPAAAQSASAQPAAPAKRSAKSAKQPAPATPWVANPPPNTLLLLPATLHLGKTAQTTLDAAFTRQGYHFHLAGNAAPARLLVFQKLLPPATDSLAALFPTPIPEAPQRLDITCARDWTAPAQTCTTAAAPKPTPRRRR